jgi:TfoX N-terminal domain
MAYDEDLADRVRVSLQHVTGVSEKKMFGGHAFLVGGHMAVAASGGGGLLLRCDPADTDGHVEQAGIDRFEMRGREMDGWLHVDLAVVDTDEQLARWVAVGVDHAETLPPK